MGNSAGLPWNSSKVNIPGKYCGGSSQRLGPAVHKHRAVRNFDCLDASSETLVLADIFFLSLLSADCL